MKRVWNIPRINPTMETPAPGGDVVIGGGSGQDGIDPITDAVACSYSYWYDHYAQEYTDDDVIDENDYAIWWDAAGFGEDLWKELNPDLPWEDYFD